MLAYLLALSIVCTTSSEKIQNAVKSYVEGNFGADRTEYQYDFRRVNLNYVPAEFDSVKVFRIGKDAPIGNTIFTLGIYNENELAKVLPVSIEVTMIVDAAVASMPLNTGEEFHDISIVKRMVTGKNQLPITDPARLEGKQAKKYIPAGSVIFPSMVENVPVIKSGDKIDIVIEKGMIKVTAEGVARQKGGVGDLIRVVNLGSKKIIKAEIIDSATVALK